ncbi:hypothetical protein AAF712_015224 [Marasmius tenuissimus]|uniref:Polyketide synthase n=1 Tax=Marasmius tenuissimus TaxID=585030 RepID=A0ABR2ZBD1_9AGAR
MYEVEPRLNRLFVTAVTDERCVTVSGQPAIVEAFTRYLESIHGPSVTVHRTGVHTLYHSPIHDEPAGIKKELLEDCAKRGVRFPNFEDIVIPFRSSYDGSLLTSGTQSNSSLLETVVDMLLTQPVNWTRVVQGVRDALPGETGVNVMNVGPGKGLVAGMERALGLRMVTVIDISTGNPQEGMPKREPIAIVGMAVNMPGSPNVSKLWDVLEQGINTISPIPEERFQVSDYNGKNAKRQMKARTGNFIDGADEFDNAFFKISPREARSMDPQQRILLHTAYEALEDSGYVPNATPCFAPETFGCYVGATAHDYVHNLQNDIDVYYSTGTLNAFLCGRVSYVLQLSGPSLVVDTACSSSSVAIYQACRALSNGDCNAALAGGVNVITSPDLYLGLDRAHFLSPTGQCQAFDASADGYSRSEGCGMFVLKRLSDAVTENDNILGVIRAISVNQSGRASSITHPHAPTQANLFRSLLDDAGIRDPTRINVVEAHGTGTQAGDPNELQSIRGVLCQNRHASNPLHVTSIKANIGHVETASGAAGLAKLCLMMKHSIIPPQISLRSLNPSIAPLESDNTVIDTSAARWVPSHPGATRLALLNNFGAAGSNTAMIVEDYKSPKQNPSSPQLPLIFGFSAKDEKAVARLRTKYLEFFQSSDSIGVDLADLAYTMTARRQIYRHRTAVFATSKEELLEKLEHPPVRSIPERPSRVLFVFSGQGGQYGGMGRLLYETCPPFKDEIDCCNKILLESGFPSVLPIINSLTETVDDVLPETYQTTVFAVEYALSRLWMTWGIVPTAVIGHRYDLDFVQSEIETHIIIDFSLGEYAALVIAGVLSLRAALLVVAHRARFMFERCRRDTSGMLAVASSREAIGLLPDVSVACVNGPSDCVLSGPINRLREVREQLRPAKSALLNVPFGYHSRSMLPVLDPLSEFTSQLEFSAPTIPIASNVSGATILPGDDSVFRGDYFSRHCAEPVQFEKGIQSIMQSIGFGEGDICIEIGPHPISLPYLKTNPSVPQGMRLLPSIRKKQDPWTTLTTSLTDIYLSNVPVDWRKVFSHIPQSSCVHLPSYPFHKQKFWVPFVEPCFPSSEALSSKPAALNDVPSVDEFALLDTWVQHPTSDNGMTSVFETPLSALSRLILGHSVGGVPLCPASAHMEAALSAIKLTVKHQGSLTSTQSILLRKNEFMKPLLYDPTTPCILKISITIDDDEYGSFSICSSPSSSSQPIVYARGEYRIRNNSRTSSKFNKLKRRSSVLSESLTQADTIHTRTAYEVIFPRVVKYGVDYRSMEHVTATLDGKEAIAQVTLPSASSHGRFVLNPIFMDSILHVSGFVVNLHGEENDGYICHEVGNLKVLHDLMDITATYTVHCRNVWSYDRGSVASEVWAHPANEPDRILLHSTGITFKRVRLDVLKRSLALSVSRQQVPTSTYHSVDRLPSFKAPFNFQQDAIGLQPCSPERNWGQFEAVLAILADTVGMEVVGIDLDSSLESLGVDSLMSIELVEKLHEAFPELTIDPSDLSTCLTVRDLAKRFETPIMTFPHSPLSTPLSTASESHLYPPTPLSMETEPAHKLSHHLELTTPTIFSPTDPTETIRDALGAILNMPSCEIKDDTSFDLLGLDSLASIELLHELQYKHNLPLPDTFFVDYATLGAIRSSFSTTAPSAVVPTGLDLKVMETLRLSSNPTLVQNPSTSKPPLFLIHDGSGLSSYYSRMLPLDRALWAIHNPNFISSEPWNDLSELATVYAKFITSSVKSGPVLIGGNFLHNNPSSLLKETLGWSFGSVAAYETAVQIQKLVNGRATDVRVTGLVLVDPPNPIKHAPMSTALVKSTMTQRESGTSPTAEWVRRQVEAQFASNAALLGKYDPYHTRRQIGSQPWSCPPIALLRSTEGYTHDTIQVPEWLSNRSDPSTALRGWSELSETLRVWDIPGNHFQPFNASHIREVSLRIEEACKYLE